MEVTLVLNIPPFSINQMYYNKKGYIRTEKYREWCRNAFYELSKNYNIYAMKQIREAFEPAKHVLEVECIAFYPDKKLITKQGRISSKSVDLTNWEKPLQDLIFDTKYYDRYLPEGVANLNMDDKYVVKLLSQKRIASGDDYQILFTIKILPLESINA